MKKLNVSKESLEAVESYNESIHGKAVGLGSEQTADCVSCHATSAIHDIYKLDEKEATVHEDNLVNTCRQCHENVNERFVQIDVHSRIEKHEKPILYFMNLGLTFVFYSSVFGLVGLMVLESYGRRKDGIGVQLKNGTTWNRKAKKRKTKESKK